jgi:Ca2+-binding RTX toxin-like protein
MAIYVGSSVADSLNGSTGDDEIYGLDGDDFLYGDAGNDRLEGGNGNDILDGGTGDDVMVGGGGDDIYWVDSAADTVTELTGGGTDTVKIRLGTYTMPANVEILDLRYVWTGITTLSMTGNTLANTFIMGWGDVTVNGLGGNDTASYLSLGAVTVDLLTGINSGNAASHHLVSIENLTGSTGDDILRGTNGANLLDGGVGADTLVGRAGNDVYIVDNSGDVVVEATGEGVDEVRVKDLSSYTLGADVEKLTNLGASNFTGYGNSLNNDLIGGQGIDWLYGQDGNDYLSGGVSGDHLFGGAGNDTLIGGSGTNWLAGGTGNDTYFLDHVGDMITENEDEGTDTVYASIDSYYLPDYVENLQAGLGGVDFHGTGNDGDNVVTGLDGDDTLDGGWGNDEIRGDAGDDLLFGGYGDDLLVGGAGADTLVGGDGADVFRLGIGDSGTGAAADLIADFAQGQDRVDLFALDADLLTPGNQAFSFIDGDAFSGAAGELRFEYDGTYTWLQGDLDGDSVADFEVRFTGDVTLLSSDFIL